MNMPTSPEVVLINPGEKPLIYQALGNTLSALEPPVWAGLMASFLRGKGVCARILDANAEGLSAEQVAERVRSISPALAAIVVYGNQPSASTQTMAAARLVCAALKERSPETKVILVGGHASALPERTLREEAADFVGAGEGPVTLWELLQALRGGRPEDLAKVQGLWYREGKEVRSNAAPPLIRDLETQMPGVAWDLLPMHLYRAHNWHCFGDLERQPYASLYTTLGCPFHCSFCLLKGTTIVTVHGRNKKIEDVKIGDTVMAWDEKAQKLSESTVIATGSRWVQALLRIRMQTGEAIEVTDEHPIYTPQGWVNAGDLQVGQRVLTMEKRDKLGYVRTVHNPSRRPEVRAKLSQMRRVSNPVARPEVRAKISATLRRQRDVLAERLRRLHADGRIPHAPMSETRRREQSERMRRDNPMRREEVVRRVAQTQKQRIALGEIVPYLKTMEGRRVIAAIARRRALTANPMKDPAVALAPPLRRRRADFMRALWQDEARADRLVKSREGKYVTGERHWAWAGGISEEPYPPQFSAYLRRKIRRRDGHSCQHCDRRDTLSVHHIDYNKTNCDPCNLITLCVSCNSKANGNRKRWEAYYREKVALIGNCPRFVAIESIEKIRGEFQAFNFQCSPHDNYFAERLLVHNCCIQAPFKSGEKALGLKEQVNSYRFWSPRHVVDDIERLVKRYGMRNIKFADEMFVLNLNHVGGICDEIIRRGVRLNIWAYTRVDTIRDSILEKLKRAGVNWLAFGIESANERVRNDVQKGFGQEQIVRTIRKVQEAGIHVIGNYIFGLPEDDLKTMQETLDLALELNCEFANLYCAMAYPGSPLYNLALEQRWPLPGKWSGYSQHSVDTLPLPTKYLSAGEVLAFRDRAFHTYFSSPRYLQMILQKFGQKTADHIREMTSIRLVREHVPGGRQAQEVAG